MPPGLTQSTDRRARSRRRRLHASDHAAARSTTPPTASTARSGTSASPTARSSPTSTAARTIDATGMVVFPGGVDVHTHVAGAALNFARGLIPEQHRKAAPDLPQRRTRRAGIGGTTPTTFATGYLYAGMGWTTVNEAAVPDPVRQAHPRGTARHAHRRQDLLRADGQQRDPARPARGRRVRAGQARRRLEGLGGEGVRRQGGQPRRRRGVEVGQGRQGARRRRSPGYKQGDAGEDHLGPRPDRRRAEPAAPAAPALQQPRRAGQLHDHARNDEGAGGQPGPPGPPPVPRLRRRRLVHDAVRSRPRSPSTSTPTRT